MSKKSKLKIDPPIRVIDLFCGGGGLSLGFDTYSGKGSFQTILGIDNESSAIRIFNNNFSGDSGSPFQVGRLTDVNWFTHPAEIQLYYLVHIAFISDNVELKTKLSELGFYNFLSKLKTIDSEYSESINDFLNSENFKTNSSAISSDTTGLAIVKGSARKLGISSLVKPYPNPRFLPWTEEYEKLSHFCGSPSLKVRRRTALGDSSERQFESILQNLRGASEKTGRGQNVNNSHRLKQTVKFLESDTGRKFRNLWVDWTTSRESARASFCLRHLDSIASIYQKNRVHLILGGPPCKGFSRIGRPVIASLRDQGVHAWSHREFGDERNALMLKYVLFIEALEPDVFLFENVSNFQSVLKTPSGKLNAPQLLEGVIEELSTKGQRYCISHRLINAKHYTVPQDRRRFIMFGVNAYKIDMDVSDQFFSTEYQGDHVKLESALWGLSEPTEFSPSNNITSDWTSPVYEIDSKNMPKPIKCYWEWIRQKDPRTRKATESTDAHIFRKLREDDSSFLKYVAPNIRWMDLKIKNSYSLKELCNLLKKIRDDLNDDDLTTQINNAIGKLDESFMLRILLEQISEKFNLPENHLLEKNYLKNGAAHHGDWFERLSADKPCKTIVAHIGKDTYGYFHPYQNRAITIRESARIQSFPDWFSFRSVGVVDAYTAIGNAVPPLVAQHFAKNLDSINGEHGLFHKEQNANPYIKRESAPKQLVLVDF